MPRHQGKLPASDSPWGSQGRHGEESACQCRRRGCNLWVGKTPREGNGNPLQYFCLENSMDRGARWATLAGVTESNATEHAHTGLPHNPQCDPCCSLSQARHRGQPRERRAWTGRLPCERGAPVSGTLRLMKSSEIWNCCPSVI